MVPAPVIPVSAPTAAEVAEVPAAAPAAVAVAEAVAPVAPPPAKPFVLATDKLATLAADAGLQWVQSDTVKIAAVQAAMAAEPAAAHVPRELPRQVIADDGPLVMVETRKDLSQLKLPFENAGR